MSDCLIEREDSLLQSMGNSYNHEIKLNTSRGICEYNHRRSCYGGILRNGRGFWMRGFMGRLAGSSMPVEAEMLAIYRGVELVDSLELKYVTLETDSSYALYLLDHEPDMDGDNEFLIALVMECRMLIEKNAIILKAISPTENKCAHLLAKMAINDDDVEDGTYIDVLVPPPGIKDLILADIRRAKGGEDRPLPDVPYNVSPELSPYINSVTKRHGDIASSCSFESDDLCRFTLEMIAKVVKDIKEKRFLEIEFKSCELETWYKVLHDAERAKIDVSWLCKLLDQVSNYIAVTGDEKEKETIMLKKEKMAMLNSEIDPKKLELSKLDLEIESKKQELMKLKLEIESKKAKMVKLISEIEPRKVELDKLNSEIEPREVELNKLNLEIEAFEKKEPRVSMLPLNVQKLFLLRSIEEALG